MKNNLSDEWQTPQWLFDELNIEYGPFDIDLCANKDNSKCPDFCDDYLNNSVHITMFDDSGSWPLDFNCIKNAAFMNPPYSNPKPFIEKAWEDSKYCKIVCLVKCDPSTRWWATFWNYEDQYICPKCNNTDLNTQSITINLKSYSCYNCGYSTTHYLPRTELKGPKPGCDVIFFPKRIKSDPPQQLIDSGEVYDLFTPRHLGATEPTYKPKWVQKCNKCAGEKYNYFYPECRICKGKRYKELSGPAFSCALLIFDRRGIL